MKEPLSWHVNDYVINHGKENHDQAWILSPFDTWHRNPFYEGPPVPHPEEERLSPREIAMKMLELGELLKKVKEIQDEIEPYVLEDQKSLTVGDVSAKYSGGRNTYDYETPGKLAPMDVIKNYTTHHDSEVKVIEAYDETDWKAVCKAAGIEPEITKPATPKVKFELS